MSGGGGTHQGASLLLVSVRGCWPSFVFIFGCSLLSGVALVVIVARDVALPHHHWLFRCWLVVCRGCRWSMAAVSGRLLGMVVMVGGVVTGVVDGG